MKKIKEYFTNMFLSFLVILHSLCFLAITWYYIFLLHWNNYIFNIIVFACITLHFYFFMCKNLNTKMFKNKKNNLSFYIIFIYTFILFLFNGLIIKVNWPLAVLFWILSFWFVNILNIIVYSIFVHRIQHEISLWLNKETKKFSIFYWYYFILIVPIFYYSILFFYH